MKTVNQNNSAVVLKTKFVAVLVVVLLSSGTMFSQTVNSVEEVSVETTLTVTNSVDIVSVDDNENSNLNLFSWFMGTKQTPNTNLKNDNSNSLKKQMINSGIEPNRLLIKTFLKKMSNYNQVIV
jgi:hypothetical protein